MAEQLITNRGGGGGSKFFGGITGSTVYGTPAMPKRQKKPMEKTKISDSEHMKRQAALAEATQRSQQSVNLDTPHISSVQTTAAHVGKIAGEEHLPDHENPVTQDLLEADTEQAAANRKALAELNKTGSTEKAKEDANPLLVGSKGQPAPKELKEKAAKTTPKAKKK